MWGMDPTMLPKSDERFNYLAVAVDHLSKYYVEAAPLKMKEAHGILAFFDNICSRFGFPTVVITNQGKEFCNQLFEDYCTISGIKHGSSSAYPPQTNGLTERMTASTKAGLIKLKERKGDWPRFFNQVLRGLRCNSLFEHATVTTEFPFDHNSFELVQLTLDGHHRVNFFCLYRPPPSKVNKLTDGMFFEEFSELLEHAYVMGGKTLFLGDFNISWDRPAHPNTVKAVDLLDMFSLSQAVNFPTHRDGHTIDWCVFREEELILRSVSRGPSLTSDHMPVMCYLDIAKPASTPVFQIVRNLRAIDKSQFRADVAAVFHNQPPATVEQLEAHLRAVLDVHAPAIRLLQTQRRSSPWYSAIAEELRSLKQKRRVHHSLGHTRTRRSLQAHHGG
ncbi:hypothetical protein ACOMHN_029432 [Nucella lapillus]